MSHAFVAYPAKPKEIEHTLEETIRIFNAGKNRFTAHSWRAPVQKIGLIPNTVRASIDNCDVLFADITTLNFNVCYEIGYAIGKQRKVVLIANTAIDRSYSDLGTWGDTIFGTAEYVGYDNFEDLLQIMEKSEYHGIKYPYITAVDRVFPIYFLEPDIKNDAAVKMRSRLKKHSKLRARVYDSYENGPLRIDEALNHTASALGVVGLIQPENIRSSRDNNIRIAFVAGFASSLRKKVCILNESANQVPMDLRDSIVQISAMSSIDGRMEEFCNDIRYAVSGYQFSNIGGAAPAVQAQLARHFSEFAAESEQEDLAKIYVYTPEYEAALSGDARVVVGRKGSGKTALMYRLTSQLQGRSSRGYLVAQLAPEGYQIRRLKDELATLCSHGSAEYLLTSFWEAILILEICQKLIEDYRQRSPQFVKDIKEKMSLILEDYANFFPDDVVEMGDFAERFSLVVDNVSSRFREMFSVEFEGDNGNDLLNLDKSKILNLMYGELLPRMLEGIKDICIEHDLKLRVLIDNIDKGIAAQGLDEVDAVVIRSLMDASRKIERWLQRRNVELASMIFLREDIYHSLVDMTSDRGKDNVLRLDWTDNRLLEQVVAARVGAAGMKGAPDFRQSWNYFCNDTVGFGDSWKYVLDRCLMRPRFLIALLGQCMSSAFITARRTKIAEEDFIEGERRYSQWVTEQVAYELRDSAGFGKDFLKIFAIDGRRIFDFRQLADLFDKEDLLDVGEQARKDDEVAEMVDELLNFGFLGIYRADNDERYIYNFSYDISMMRVFLRETRREETKFCVNLAFCPYLMIES